MRELVALMSKTGGRSPLLLLILGTPPPVAVAGRGRLSLEEAIAGDVADVLAKAPEVAASVDVLIDRLPETIAWITWAKIAEVTRRQGELFRQAPDGSLRHRSSPDVGSHSSDRLAQLTRLIDAGNGQSLRKEVRAS